MAELSLIKFFKQFPTEEKAAEYFEKLRWGETVVCPYCGSIHISRTKLMPYRCRDCRKHFSVRTGTALAESRLPLQKWLLAMYILTNAKKGISSVQLAEYLGITQKSAWFLAHRIRESWVQTADKLAGIIEVDETYIGGKEKNKHNSKKAKEGRGTVGKQPVIGLKSRVGKVKSFVIYATDTRTLTDSIRKNVEIESHVYTDEWKAYKDLNEFNHQKVNHSVGEFVNGQVFTNGIESLWALVKRGYYGIYHQWSVKHLQRYINEFCLRQNIVGDIEKISYTFLNSIGRRLMYRDLIAA